VRAPLGPIDARSAKNPTPRASDRKVNPEAGEKCCASLGDFAGLVSEDHVLARDQAIRNADAKFASQVIVAGTRVPERFVGIRTRLKSRRSGERYRHDAFEHLAHVRSGQSIVTVAALLAEID
jgi:hypothetical protein